MPHLTPEQKSFYEENGYIALSGLFTEKEMEEISTEYDYIFATKNNPQMEAAWAGDEMKKNYNSFSVKSIHNLQYHSDIFSKILLKENLLDAFEDIMGTKNILLHHTKAHFKPPANGAPFLMHQDYHYFPYKRDSMVAAFLHVDDSTPENGGLCIYPGSHKMGPQEDVGAVETGGTHHYLDKNKFPIDEASPVSAKRGDLIIFSYLLIHGSYLNVSTRSRRMFLLQTMAAEDEPLSEDRRPGTGWVLRGRNMNRGVNLAKRFDD